MEFVRVLLGRERLFRYADPLGALNLAVMRDGDELAWHVDQTDFVVSLALQSSEACGVIVQPGDRATGNPPSTRTPNWSPS